VRIVSLKKSRSRDLGEWGKREKEEKKTKD